MRRIVRVVVSGRVQGVGYRMWCVGQASGLGLDGWVRNLGDGAVEAAFAGEPHRVDLMLASCWVGPPMADVIAVSATASDVTLLELRAGQGGFIVLGNA